MIKKNILKIFRLSSLSAFFLIQGLPLNVFAQQETITIEDIKNKFLSEALDHFDAVIKSKARKSKNIEIPKNITSKHGDGRQVLLDVIDKKISKTTIIQFVKETEAAINDEVVLVKPLLRMKDESYPSIFWSSKKNLKKQNINVISMFVERDYSTSSIDYNFREIEILKVYGMHVYKNKSYIFKGEELIYSCVPLRDGFGAGTVDFCVSVSDEKIKLLASEKSIIEVAEEDLNDLVRSSYKNRENIADKNLNSNPNKRKICSESPKYEDDSNKFEWCFGVLYLNESLSGDMMFFDKYTGEFTQSGELGGFGTLKFKNGDIYSGGFKDGKLHGHGAFYSIITGGRYVGEFVNGEYHGDGIYYDKNSGKFSGFWRHGKLVEYRGSEKNSFEKLLNYATPPKKIINKQEDASITSSNNSLTLKVLQTEQNSEGEFLVKIKTNANIASLKINGEEQGSQHDGKYTIKLIARAGQTSTFEIKATDIFGNTETKTITASRPIAESKPLTKSLNPAQVKRQPERDAVAVIIGIADYKNLPRADYANDDARVFYDYAIRALGVKPENIRLLVDADADQAEIYRAFKTWLPSRVRNSTDVYVYYSGHGLPTADGQGLYVLPQRADRDFIDKTAITQSEINIAIQAAKPKSVTVFLDACYSGQARTGETLLASARPVALKVERQLFPDSFTVISASQADQISSSSPELKHGIFSYYLMRGMEGDADANRDGRITVGEMHTYLTEQVARQAGMMNRQQVPQLVGDANRVLVGR